MNLEFTSLTHPSSSTFVPPVRYRMPTHMVSFTVANHSSLMKNRVAALGHAGHTRDTFLHFSPNSLLNWGAVVIEASSGRGRSGQRRPQQNLVVRAVSPETSSQLSFLSWPGLGGGGGGREGERRRRFIGFLFAKVATSGPPGPSVPPPPRPGSRMLQIRGSALLRKRIEFLLRARPIRGPS